MSVKNLHETTRTRFVKAGRKTLTAIGLCLAALVCATPVASALTHPGVVFNKADLDNLKSSYQTTEPWKTGYSVFNTTSQASINYAMQGPFTVVGRETNQNLSQYESDMLAAYYQAIQWYITGNATYAEKARQILNAWATTHTTWSGATPRLAAGWDGMHAAIAGEILRYTYTGWTTTNTTNLQNYLLNVVWPCAGGSGNDTPNLSDANQGAMELRGLMAIAVFCDDQTRFNNVVNQFLNHPCGGLYHTTLSTGQNADFGRDQGHDWVEEQCMLLAAETAWKQGVDLYSTLNNRLRAVSEFICTYNTGGSVKFTNFGACYGYYTAPGGTLGDNKTQQIMLNLVHGAYATRLGISCPASDALLSSTCNPINENSFLYARIKDGSTPSVQSPGSSLAAPPSATTLTNVDVGGVGLAGSGNYSNGVWTVQGSGLNMWNTADSFHFVYQQLTGDGVIMAHVTGNQANYNRANAGVMMRETFNTDSRMMHVSIDPPGNPGAYGVESFWRDTTGANIGSNQQFHANVNVPGWVKIERRGNTFIGYDSLDGVTWTPVRYMYSAMVNTIYVGLVVCSHDNTSLATATFDNVRITGASGGMPDGMYWILNRTSGKYLDNQGSTSNGALVGQWSYSGGNNQAWQLTTTGSYRKLVCSTGSKRLDSLGHTGNGATCGEWDDSTSYNQQWTLQSIGGGYYQIVNRANGLCLDSAGQTTNGATMQFWSNTGSNNQQWSLFLPEP